MLFKINSTGWFTKDGRFQEREFEARWIELSGATFDQSAGKITVGVGGGGFVFDYEQSTDPTLDNPNTVTARQWWRDTTEGAERIGIRNADNTVWVFFLVSSGSGINYIQDTDPTLNIPNTVVAGRTWAKLTDPATFAVRNAANTAWVFFFPDSGGGEGQPPGAVTDSLGATVTDSLGATVTSA